MASPADVSRTVALNEAFSARLSATVVQRPGSESPASQTLAWMAHAVASPSAETEPLAVTKSGAILERPAEAVAEVHATVSPEDYIGPASENPSDLDFLCSVEFDRIDFTTCDLQFQEVYFSQDRVSYLGVLPGFFWGENADIRFTSPRLLIDYVNDFPYTSSRVDVVAFFEDEYDRQTVTFSLSDNGKYLYMPKADGIQREGIQTIEIGDMEKMLSSPLPNGALFARLLLQPVFSTSGTFVPEQEYLMSIKATWMLPRHIPFRSASRQFVPPPTSLSLLTAPSLL